MDLASNPSELLEFSIGHYEALQRKMSQLENNLGTFQAEELLTATGQLQDIQTVAREVDARLNACLTEHGAACVPPQRLAERGRLLSALNQQNHLMIQRLEGMMAVMAHELANNRQTRHAMAGYRPSLQRNGNVLNGSC
jgi:hypothetical protein